MKRSPRGSASTHQKFQVVGPLNRDHGRVLTCWLTVCPSYGAARPMALRSANRTSALCKPDGRRIMYVVYTYAMSHDCNTSMDVV